MLLGGTKIPGEVELLTGFVGRGLPGAGQHQPPGGWRTVGVSISVEVI